MKRFLLILVLVVSGCAGASGDATTSAVLQEEVVTTSPETTATGPPDVSTTTASPRLPAALPEAIGVGVVRVDETELVVAVADTAELRRQGLMYVDDLLDLDGMLFVFAENGTRRFWMKNTLVALDIAFFDEDGGFVDGFVMEPCEVSPCPTYEPAGQYRYALEMVAGTMPTEPQLLVIEE